VVVELQRLKERYDGGIATVSKSMQKVLKLKHTNFQRRMKGSEDAMIMRGCAPKSAWSKPHTAELAKMWTEVNWPSVSFSICKPICVSNMLEDKCDTPIFACCKRSKSDYRGRERTASVFMIEMVVMYSVGATSCEPA
jgi:hypothetical protein